MSKVFTFLFLTLCFVQIRAASVGLTSEYDDSKLNNVEGYLEQKKRIMEEYYARMKEVRDNKKRGLNTEINIDNSKRPTIGTTTESALDITTGTVLFGACKDSSVKIIRFTNTVNGASSSGNSFKYNFNGVCIDCITIEKLGEIRVVQKSGGPGKNHIHLEFDNPKRANSRVVINVLGKYENCSTE